MTSKRYLLFSGDTSGKGNGGFADLSLETDYLHECVDRIKFTIDPLTGGIKDFRLVLLDDGGKDQDFITLAWFHIFDMERRDTIIWIDGTNGTDPLCLVAKMKLFSDENATFEPSL